MSFAILANATLGSIYINGDSPAFFGFVYRITFSKRRTVPKKSKLVMDTNDVHKIGNHSRGVYWWFNQITSSNTAPSKRVNECACTQVNLGKLLSHTPAAVNAGTLTWVTLDKSPKYKRPLAAPSHVLPSPIVDVSDGNEMVSNDGKRVSCNSVMVDSTGHVMMDSNGFAYWFGAGTGAEVVSHVRHNLTSINQRSGPVWRQR